MTIVLPFPGYDVFKNIHTNGFDVTLSNSKSFRFKHKIINKNHVVTLCKIWSTWLLQEKCKPQTSEN